MTEETNKECCSAKEGQCSETGKCCSESTKECCSVQTQGKCPSKDALVIAGAVLLGSLIVAATVFFVNSKATTVAPTTQDDKQAEAAAQAGKTEVTMDQVKGLFTDKNITFGKKDSKVLFVEFSDPSCPYCNIAAGKNPNLNKQAGAQFTMAKDGGSYIPPVPEMKKLVDAGKAGYVWMYANGHGNGELATEALYCAHEKGKFWAVHDLLMTEAGYNLLNNTIKADKTKTTEMADFLKSVMSVGDMQSCLESGKYESRLTEDMAVAKQFGFAGTPSFFANTKNFAGAYSFKDIQPTVDQYLK